MINIHKKSVMADYKRLERNPMNKVIGGVCSGLADYFNLDVALVRILFVIALLFASFGFWLYIILWIFIPERDLNFNFNNEQHQSWEYQPKSEDVDNSSNYVNKKNTTVFAGVIVILLGFIFLINNFIPISWVWKLWPIILVLIGAIMIVNAIKKNNNE